MKLNSLQTQLIMRYFLGELSEEEQSQFEERFLADPELFQEIRATRDDLIDAYLRGELSNQERERFKKHFLASPHRRERVEFARALIKTVDQKPQSTAKPAVKNPTSPSRSLFLIPQVSFKSAIVALAVIAFLFLGYWLLSRNSGRIQEAKRTISTPQTNQPDIAAPTPSPTESVGPDLARKPTVTPTRAIPDQNIATFTLTPGALRDSTAKVLLIPRELNQVELRLEIEGESYPRYAAELRTAEGDRKWSKAQIRPESDATPHTVVVRISAALFENADYVLRINGVTAANSSLLVGSYYFRVEKK